MMELLDQNGGRPNGVSRDSAMNPRARLPSVHRWPIMLAAALVGLSLVVAAGRSQAATELTTAIPKKLQQPEVADLKPLFCRATPIPKQHTTDGSGYTAIQVGPDGKVYIGTARYYNYGHWVAYDPKDRSVDLVLEIRKTVAEDRYDVNTQSKTHTKLAVGPDGKIYGGTKQGHELFATRPEIGEQSGGYPGGHLISYDPATGVSQDLGILRAQDGLMNGIYDHARGRIYFKTEPRMHLLIYEVDTHQVIDKGRVGTWGRYIDMDGAGNVWIPNHGGILTKYDVAKDEVLDYTVQVEGEGRPYGKAYACAIGGRDNKRGMKLYGGDFTQIQEFDLTRAADGFVPMRYVCPAVPQPFEKSSDIHAMIRDDKGRIYWPATVETAGEPNQLLVMRYDPDTQKSECLGYCVDVELDQHEEVKNHTAVQGITMAADGTLYLLTIGPMYVLEFPQLAAK